jgi:hypothetical protein
MGRCLIYEARRGHGLRVFIVNTIEEGLRLKRSHPSAESRPCWWRHINRIVCLKFLLMGAGYYSSK